MQTARAAARAVFFQRAHRAQQRRDVQQLARGQRRALDGALDVRRYVFRAAERRLRFDRHHRARVRRLVQQSVDRRAVVCGLQAPQRFRGALRRGKRGEALGDAVEFQHSAGLIKAFHNRVAFLCYSLGI